MIVLPPNLKKNIDEKWDNCWPVSNLRPSALLDLISYIFFIKKLDDKELLNKNSRIKQNDNFIYTKDVEEFNWVKLKNMNSQSIHDLFTGEHGIIDLMNQYGHSNSLYSDFFKIPLLLSPTPKMLFNVVEIINLIEISDKKTQAAIAEYLFSKIQIAEQDKYEFIPEHIARLIVSIADPSAKDLIWDPSASDCSLLINANNYIVNRNAVPSRRFENETAGGNGNLLKNGYSHRSNLPDYQFESSEAKLKGVESDLIQLRLGAMNMVLHGIKNPDLEPNAEKSLKTLESPTLIISNLIFPDIESEVIGEDNIPQPPNFKKEIELFKEIMENLQPEGRAVIIVPEVLLKSSSAEIKKIRQDIIDNFILEGVINLFSKSNSTFSGAGILIFNKHVSINTGNVWFCKMEKTNSNGQTNNIENDVASPGLNEINNILKKWKSRTASQINDYNSFYISAYDIKANNYNLNFNDYKVIRDDRELNENIADKTKLIVATKRGNLQHFYEESVPIQKEKPKRRLLTAVIIILILILAGGGFYFYDFKTNNFNFFTPAKTAGIASSTSSTDSLNYPTANVTVADSSNHSPANINNTASNTASSNHSTAATGDINKPKNLPVSPIKAKNTNASNLNTPPAISKKYTVISKAYFYREPDTSTQKSLFLQSRSDLILTATNEQNGFIYVVYVNKQGDATRGWLNKKDLLPVE